MRHRSCAAILTLATTLLALACGGGARSGEPATRTPAPGHEPPGALAAAPAIPSLPAAAAAPPAAHGVHGLSSAGPAERVDAALRSVDPAEKARRSRPVALVNGEAVTLYDLEQRLEEVHGGQQAASREAFSVERLVFRLVNDRLLAQEARTLGMDREEPTKSQVDRFRREEMLRQLERDEILSRAKATDAEIRKAFQEQYRRIDLRVVTLDSKEQAQEVLSQIRAGADMDPIARQRSRDPYAARGGYAAGLPRRDLAPEVGSLTARLKPGELGGPVMTDLGWTVLRLEKFQDADPEAFEGAKPILRDLITMQKVAARRAELASRIGATFPVRVDEAARAAILPERLPDGRLSPIVKDRQAIVVRIGKDGAIRAGEYGDALLLRWSGVRNEDAAKAAAPIILQNLIEKGLLLAEARAKGYDARREVVERVRAQETELLVQRYLEEVVGKPIPVAREEMRAYYDARRDTFPKPPRLHLAQITVAKQDEADEVADLLRRGTDLAWLARQRSTDRLAESGGDRGWLTPQPGSDDLNDRLMRARPGDVLGPYGAEGNFIVLKVTAREEQGLYSFEEVSGNVRSAVFSEKFRKALDDLMTRLRARARIEVKEDVLASLRISGKVEDEPAARPAPHADAH